MAAMRNVILPTGDDKFPVAELDKEICQYSPIDRTMAVDTVYASISDDERQGLNNEVIIHDGYGSASKNYWVFLFLCAAARKRPGSTPLDIARDINRAESARGILLAS